MEAPTDMGGLGFGNLKVKNLAKWWWKYSSKSDVLWKRVVKSTNWLASDRAIYDEFANWSTKTLSVPATTSKQLPWIANIVVNIFSNQIGKGDTILFWKDIWVDSQPLKDLFPHSRTVICWYGNLEWSSVGMESQVEEKAFPMEQELLTNLFSLIDRHKPSVGREDRVVWKGSKDNIFSVKSFSQLT